MKNICGKCKEIYVTHKKYPKKPDTITIKQWNKNKYGTIFKSSKGLFRKNFNKGNNFYVKFLKVHESRHNNPYTYYCYNDLRHDYKIYKY